MRISLVVTMDIADDLSKHALKQELRLIRKDIEMCMGTEGYPLSNVEVTPVQETSELRKAQHFHLYL